MFRDTPGLDAALGRGHARQATPGFQPATVTIAPEANAAHTLAAAGRGAIVYYQLMLRDS